MVRRLVPADLYHLLLTSSWPRLLGLLALAYGAANALFALGYLLEPGALENAREGSFADAFFFSVQTMATIGYGKLVPRSTFANLLVTVEALTGLLGFAVATGLIFAKFARLTARVMFSQVACISLRNGVPSLLFRLANVRANQMVEAQLRLSFARLERTAEGESLRRFIDVPLVRSQNTIFALTWTAIHVIDERSPLHGATPASVEAQDGEFIVSLVGLDGTTSQTVHALHSYRWDDLRWNERFVDVLLPQPTGQLAVDYRNFHSTTPVDEKHRIALPGEPVART